MLLKCYIVCGTICYNESQLTGRVTPNLLSFVARLSVFCRLYFVFLYSEFIFDIFFCSHKTRYVFVTCPLVEQCRIISEAK